LNSALASKKEADTLRVELDQLQAASIEELGRKQAEVVASQEELTTLRRNNEWLQKSASEAAQAIS